MCKNHTTKFQLSVDVDWRLLEHWAYVSATHKFHNRCHTDKGVREREELSFRLHPTHPLHPCVTCIRYTDEVLLWYYYHSFRRKKFKDNITVKSCFNHFIANSKFSETTNQHIILLNNKYLKVLQFEKQTKLVLF